MSKIRREIWKSLFLAIKSDGWNMFDKIIDQPSYFEKKIKNILRGTSMYTNIEKKLVVKRHSMFKVTMYFWKETPEDFDVEYGSDHTGVLVEITNNVYTFTRFQSLLLNFGLRRMVKRLKRDHEESLERAILLKVTGFDQV